MREILFKAKREDNGEWVEGNLVHCKASVGKSELCLIVCGAEWLDNPKWFNLCNEHYVDTETVCQYTGLKDSNGNKVWENDVIKIDKPHHTGVYMVKWVEGGFQYANLNENYSFCFDDTEQYMDTNNCEVIGNIFDNPELLGV